MLDGQVIFTDEFGATQISTDPDAIAQFTPDNADPSTNNQKNSFLKELKPWSGISENGFQIWTGAYVKMLKSLTAPGIIYSLLLSSISLGTGIGCTLVYSSVLEEGYGWSPKDVGLFNAGVMPVCFLSMVYSGWFAGKMNVWLAQRNGGVHKPEHHLLHLVFPALTGVVGIVAIALCSQHPEKYSAWGLVIGWAIYQFSFTSIVITTTTFAAEVIPENPGAGVAVVVGGKNLVSFGAAYGIVPMVHQFNYLTAFMILMGIYIAICLLGIPVYFLNSKWREIRTRR